MKDFHSSCFNAWPDSPYRGELGNSWDITVGDWTPGAERMGGERNAADTEVFIVSHSDLSWMNINFYFLNQLFE